jgi:hydroxymethylbilane synthase
MRGNVDTRLRKLAQGEYDALVLALAGLERLGRADGAVPLEELVPAPGQGALIVQARADQEPVRGALAAIDDPGARARVLAERALTRALGASCRTPIGAHAERDGEGTLELRSFVGLPDGSAWVRDRLGGDGAQPERLGREAAQRLLAAGAGDLLEQAEAVS